MQISGVGSPLARVMFIVDSPNEEDTKRGRLFAGKAGAEFDYWLGRTCRLTREDIYLTSFMRQFEKKERGFTQDEIDDIWTEINGVNPEIIVPIGTLAIEHFLGEWASWELTHGLAHRRDIVGPDGPEDQTWRGTIFSLTNPGAPQYELMVWDFERLGMLLAGRLPLHELDTTPVDYRADLLPPDERIDVVAIDTEGNPNAPWCATASWADHQGTLLRPNTFEIEWFADWVHAEQPLVVMHYAPHDLRVLDAMGVHIDCSRVRVVDTMQLAYIAGRTPQGLKALGYRLCGVRMREYEDLVRDANERLAEEYLARVEGLFAPAHPKDKKHPVYKAVQRCRKSKRGARALWADQQPEILGVVGSPMPEATLDDVPFDEVLAYSCADADVTRRVFFKLREYFD